MTGESVRQRSLASLKRRREREKLKAMGIQQPREKVMREVIIPETITIQELANRMAARGGDVIKMLMRMGVMATITQTLDADTAELVVAEMGHKMRRVAEADVEIGLVGDADRPARASLVVDHQALAQKLTDAAGHGPGDGGDVRGRRTTAAADQIYAIVFREIKERFCEF